MDATPEPGHLVGLTVREPTQKTVDRELHTIFEGTSEIQRLVISRAISGIHIQ